MRFSEFFGLAWLILDSSSMVWPARWTTIVQYSGSLISKLFKVHAADPLVKFQIH